VHWLSGSGPWDCSAVVRTRIRAAGAARAAAGQARQPEGRLTAAAARLGVRLTGDWADSWDRVRHVTIEAIYALIEELDAVNA
jgi:hypothetical protein